MDPDMKRTLIALACAAAVAGTAPVLASSHREAPLITKTPKLDGTDFYLFRSYESGRSNYVTLIANYIPLQAAYGGPNFFSLDPTAVYDINVDNNGDAQPDLTFRFRFRTGYRNIAIPVNGVDVAVPLANVGPFNSSGSGALNVIESYTVDVLRPGQQPQKAVYVATGDTTFIKPHDNIGTKSIADYRGYSDKYINRMTIPGCASEAKVFVGQRRDGFAVNLGEIFDLVHTNPVGPMDGEHNDLDDANVTSIALEVPVGCLVNDSPIIGAWTTAGTYVNSQWKQVSRLSAPLINEVIIGLPDKDKFNASLPVDDAQFATYVTNPTLPELIQILFPGVTAPNLFPRTDLVAAFLTGIDGLNKPTNVRPAEMLRLNTSIAPKAAASQNTLGVIAGDTAGFPNGRRPGDDVVDIELRVAMGLLLDDTVAPSRSLPYTDGAAVSATQFRNYFPYLNTPLPGATD
jgi:hypothetical protein